jgi:hypothetical protein
MLLDVIFACFLEFVHCFKLRMVFFFSVVLISLKVFDFFDCMMLFEVI